MDYKNVPQIIDNSAWPIEIKTELKQLVARFCVFLEEERDATGEMHKAKSGCNEKQYSKRLKEPLSAEKRNEVLSHQFAYRNWFANAVMRIHEARRGLTLQAELIRNKVAELTPQADESTMFVLVTLTHMVRVNEIADDAESILAELNNVSELTRDRIVEAVRAIFVSKRDTTGIFFRQNYTSSPLILLDPTAEEKAMEEALAPAIAMRWKMEELSGEFHSARSAHNVPQFNQRMEQCIQSGEDGKLTKIRSEMANAEARLFVAAKVYVETHDDMKRVSARLESAIRNVAVSIPQLNNNAGLKAMCHCLGAWHWLGELTGYIEGKYRSCNPAAVLADLDFNPGAYIKA